MRFILSVLAAICAINTVAYAVPVMPNESMVRGNVVAYCITSSKLLGMKPEMTIYRLVITVDEVKDIKGPNFLRNKEGLAVSLYSKEKLSSDLFGKTIQATVVYGGDEKGGMFWIKHLEKFE